jgi:Putative adhesin
MRSVSFVWPVAVLWLACSGAHAADPTTFDRAVAADPHGVVDVSSTAGSIEVSGWDRPEVSVHAELGADVDHVEVTSEQGRTLVRVLLRPHIMSSFFSMGHKDTRLRVQIPKGSELDVTTVSADVTSDGVQGVQRLRTVSGDIAAELGPADLEVKSVSGDVKLRGHGQPAQLTVGTVSGDVHLDHGAGALEATTVSGEITASLDSAHSVRAHSTSGDLRIDARLGSGADFEAQTVSGDVKVRAPSADGFQYDVATLSGDISDCFNAEPERSSHYGPGHNLRGTRGAGSAHLRLRTMSGDVELCDH